MLYHHATPIFQKPKGCPGAMITLKERKTSLRYLTLTKKWWQPSLMNYLLSKILFVMTSVGFAVILGDWFLGDPSHYYAIAAAVIIPTKYLYLRCLLKREKNMIMHRHLAVTVEGIIGEMDETHYGTKVVRKVRKFAHFFCI